MTILGTTYTEREPAAKALLEARKEAKGRDEVYIGEYCGFQMTMRFDSFNTSYDLTLKGAVSHTFQIGPDAFGNLARISNMLNDLPKRLESARTQLENLHQQVRDAEAELKSPFGQEVLLAEKETRLAYLNAELNIDGGSGELDVAADAPDEYVSDRQTGASDLPRAVSYKGGKTSILNEVHAFNSGGRPASAPGRDKPADRTM